jgi:hypothetical protein
MEPLPPQRTMIPMTIPIVTELPLVLEPVAADTFLDAGDTPVD